jgi:hypothetical protein
MSWGRIAAKLKLKRSMVQTAYNRSEIKQKLKGRTLQSDSELFTAIEIAWNEISEAEIDQLVGSFRARCQACVEIEGECLNGH